MFLKKKLKNKKYRFALKKLNTKTQTFPKKKKKNKKKKMSDNLCIVYCRHSQGN